MGNLNSYYQEYKANLDAAKVAQARGNAAGASQLYRMAAKSLCKMAELESGETRVQRIMHAQSILEMAKQLEAAAPAVQLEASATSAAKGAQGGQAAAGTEEDDENPWKSEGIPSTTFDDVVGMEDVKKLIRERVIDQIKFPELYEQFGIRGGTGVLLFGLPGTGKTTIARAIAHEIEAPLYTVLLSDILNKYQGVAEQRIKQLFDKARSAPVSLIFFDDFDALGMVRSDDSSSSNNNKIIVELINQMDGFKENENTIILLAATNKPWMIDSALMRPGRFEHHFYVPLANHEARVMLVKKKLGGAPVEENLDLDAVSELIKGYNGADIESVVKSAKMAALQRSKESYVNSAEKALSPVSYEDFVTAASNHKSSVDPRDIVELRKYAAERGITLPEEM